MTLEIHEAAELLPEMEHECFERLRLSILDGGQREPIVLFDGKILDGRHRYKACLQSGVHPVCRDIELDKSFNAETFDPVEYVVATNVVRRHLNPSQLAMLGQRVKDYYAEQIRTRENFPAGRARDMAAATVGVSGKLIDAADRIVKSGTDELAAAVRTGNVTASAAAHVATLPKEEQAAAVAAGPAAVREKAKEVKAAKKKPARPAEPQQENFAPAAESQDDPPGDGPCLHGGDHVWTEDDSGEFCAKCKENKPAPVVKRPKGGPTMNPVEWEQEPMERMQGLHGEMRSALIAFKKSWNEAKEGKHGAYLQVADPRLHKAYQELWDSVEMQKPVRKCPKCDDGCKQCAGTGWLSKLQAASMPKGA